MDCESLKLHFTYCCDSGEFKRIGRSNGNGSIDHYGYLILKIKGVQYKAHRMAWLYHYGQMPVGVIDHIDGNKINNMISNLRCVSQADNTRNSTIKVNESTGYKGVHINNAKGLKKKYTVRIKGKAYRFYNPEDARIFRDNKLRGYGYGERHL